MLISIKTGMNGKMAMISTIIDFLYKYPVKSNSAEDVLLYRKIIRALDRPARINLECSLKTLLFSRLRYILLNSRKSAN